MLPWSPSQQNAYSLVWKQLCPLAATSYKHLHIYSASSIPVFLHVTIPNIICFPRNLEASRRHSGRPRYFGGNTHVIFVCKNLSDYSNMRDFWSSPSIPSVTDLGIEAHGNSCSQATPFSPITSSVYRCTLPVVSPLACSTFYKILVLPSVLTLSKRLSISPK